MKPETSIAIEAFIALERRMLSVDKAKKQLHKAVIRIPDEDMTEYVRITSEILAKRDQDRERLHLLTERR